MPNFTTQTITVIVANERFFSGQYSLPNNQNLATAISNLMQSTPTPGSVAEKLKDILNRTNATGSAIPITLTIQAG